VVEQGATDESFDRNGLRLTSKATHEALGVVGAPTDAIVVLFVGIRVRQNDLIVDGSEQADSKERDGVAMSGNVGIRIVRNAIRFLERVLHPDRLTPVGLNVPSESSCPVNRKLR